MKLYKRLWVYAHPDDMDALMAQTGERRPNWAAQAILNRFLPNPYPLDEVPPRKVSRNLWERACQIADEQGTEKAYQWLNDELAKEGKEAISLIALYKELAKYRKNKKG